MHTLLAHVATNDVRLKSDRGPGGDAKQTRGDPFDVLKKARKKESYTRLAYALQGGSPSDPRWTRLLKWLSHLPLNLGGRTSFEERGVAAAPPRLTDTSCPRVCGTSSPSAAADIVLISQTCVCSL